MRASSLSTLALLLVACIPHVAVDGAPCPCPSGFTCCATLRACVSAEAPDACPPEQPMSSGDSCAHDADCESGELCQAWKNADGKLGGPRACRKPCSAEAPCAAGEKCQLVPHDGASLYESDLARACVPSSDEASQACDCTDCDEGQLGRTYCDAEGARGCFITFNEQCGVACKTALVERCPGVCQTSPRGASCPSAQDGPTGCELMPCSKCPAEPGGSTCDGDQVVSCARSSYPGLDCDQICLRETFNCPDGSSCMGDDHAYCAP